MNTKTLLKHLAAFALLPLATLADDHGDTLQSATTLSSPDTPGQLDSLTDQDWFKLTLTQPGRLTLYTTGSTDTKGLLYDSAFREIDNGFSENDLGAGDNFHFSKKLPASTYYLKIVGGGSGLQTGSYRLKFHAPQNVTPVTTPNLSASLPVHGQHKFYRLNIPSTGRIYLYTTGSVDTYGILYDSNGNEIDNGFSEQDAGHSHNFLYSLKIAPGTYYLLVHAGDTGAQTGDYQLHLRTHEYAVPLTQPNRESSIGLPGDTDFYRLTILNVGRTIIYSSGNLNTYARLFDHVGNEIDNGFSEQDEGNRTNFLYNSYLAPGTYYLAVTADEAGLQSGPYSIHLRNHSTAIPLLVSGTSAHSIAEFGDLDIFSFSTSGGPVIFQTTGATDTYGRIFDIAGNEINGAFAGQNAGANANFKLTPTLPAGDYLLVITGANSDFVSGNYTLHSDFPEGSLTRIATAGTTITSQSTTEIQISSNENWQLTNLPSWITASKSSGSGSSSVQLTFSKNLTGDSRESTILAGGQPYTITQLPDGDQTGNPIPGQISLELGILVSIQTQLGITYELQTSADMHSWQKTGVTTSGDGKTQEFIFASSEAKSFFRAVSIN